MLDPQNIRVGEWYWCYRSSLGRQKRVVKLAKCLQKWDSLPCVFDFGSGGGNICDHVFATEFEARTHQCTVMLRELQEMKAAVNAAADELERCQQESQGEQWGQGEQDNESK